MSDEEHNDAPEYIYIKKTDQYEHNWWGVITSMADDEETVEYVRTDRHEALTTPNPEAGKGEPDFASAIRNVIAEESADGAACGWSSCTGCHETNEGYETGHYPYSELFGCNVGFGCSECGGLGVVWECWTKDALDDMSRDIAQPSAPEVASGDQMEVVAYFTKDAWGGYWQTVRHGKPYNFREHLAATQAIEATQKAIADRDAKIAGLRAANENANRMQRLTMDKRNTAEARISELENALAPFVAFRNFEITENFNGEIGTIGLCYKGTSNIAVELRPEMFDAARAALRSLDDEVK